ncbi:MAG: efflux RND transporter periplasmic adaptor subunit [Gemmatimonadota bacterium]|nr:efflux RND transporter periplasmic adaptor subunit [Gemmatimonadota bacterium]MDE2866772.1 efflux RND transporter periplasmic adaptor subunit [Gemmatimonadota bacterium]
MKSVDPGRTVMALGAAALLAGLVGCEVQEEPTGDIAVQTAPAEIRDLRITAEATGELEPVLRVEVKSKASGEILDLFVDSGDEVEPGTLLARVDPRDVQNAFDQATADLDVARARIEIARAQERRSRELLDSEVITAQEYEARQLEFANAQAAHVRAETNLELATLRLEDVTIRAPLAGTILEKQVEFGQVIQSASQNVSGGTPLFIMANLDDMRVRTLVDETDVGQLGAGMAATVTVEAFPDRTFQGAIEKIEPQAVVEQNVTMFPVIVLLDNRAGLLKPGMNAEVEVLVDERLATLTVPNNAVVQPQELAPAAEVLGLDPQSVSVDRSAWGDLMAEAATKAGVSAGSRMAGAGGMANGAMPGGAGAGGNRMADIRAAMESGDISPDSARALFAAMREQRGGGQRPAGMPEEATPEANGDDQAEAGQAGQGRLPGGQPGGRGGAGRGFGGGMMAAMGGSSGDPAFRPAVAFVVDEMGNIEPRPVVMGVSDWDYAEILAGLEEGEQLALIGAAQLQARQQEQMERMRGRFRPF